MIFVNTRSNNFDIGCLYLTSTVVHYAFLYVVAAKCSRYHFISEIRLFKLHLIQNSLLVERHTSATDCTGVGKIPGSHFMKAFSAPPSHF